MLSYGDRNTNDAVQALLTDRYQLTMAYGYWNAGIADKQSVFDLFFRKCPFGGEFAIYAGLEEVLKYVRDFTISHDDIDYLRTQPDLKHLDPDFFDWLANIDTRKVKIYAPKEGTAVFPSVPLTRVEGPLAVCQLLETTILNLTNFPTLVATNAARFRLAMGRDKIASEFGLRRAQGPDGALTASRSAYIGGFDSTSNELAGKLFGIPVSGTHAHAFVQAHSAKDLFRTRLLNNRVTNEMQCLTDKSLEKKSLLGDIGSYNSNDGELAAFLDYAVAFPDSFLALIDTYDVLKSGLPNFLTVALALSEFGYVPRGIRIDSGDLSYLSKAIRQVFIKVGASNMRNEYGKMKIVASNDINEELLWSLRSQGHEIDVFGVGTNLVTCQQQPALGGVYKLVELEGEPCIKLSEDAVKITIPGRKNAYRLYGSDDKAILDLMMSEDEAKPEAGKPVLCRHPFIENKRALVSPSRVESVLQLVWNGTDILNVNYLQEAKRLAAQELSQNIREDHLRPLNPTKYKVSVSEKLYNHLHKLMQSEAPVAVLS